MKKLDVYLACQPCACDRDAQNTKSKNRKTLLGLLSTPMHQPRRTVRPLRVHACPQGI